MTTAGRIVNCIVLILGLSMIAYYFALGIFVRFGQSLQFLWLIGGLACVARFAFWAWADRAGRIPTSPLLLPLRIIFLAAVVLFLIAEALILMPGLSEAPAGLDYIVVLGARVNGREPSGALRNRIQVAAEYLEANPDTIAVLSGGQGEGEEITEAQCMYDHLTAKGIDPARLILEDRSTDTSENLRYSREFVPDGASVGLVTNSFHICRALGLARGVGWDAKAVPVATSLFSLPHYLMREFIGVLYEFVRGNIKL